MRHRCILNIRLPDTPHRAWQVDQYVTKDATWKGADTEAPVYKLHRKLYVYIYGSLLSIL
jgi:hypothetical protein